jgi:hypothetical protein
MMALRSLKEKVMKRMQALITATVLAGAMLAVGIGVMVYPTPADAHFACCCGCPN